MERSSENQRVGRGTVESEHVEPDLRTPFVFIDTQAFVENGLDWESKHLKRLKELAQAGALRLVTTTVTKREVSERLAEKLREASAALRKVEPILRQLRIAGGEEVVSETALLTLVGNFEK